MTPHSFFPLLPSEQVLPEPTVGRHLASLSKLETMAIIVIVSLHCSTLELVFYCLFVLSAFLLLSCFLSNSCPEQTLYHTIAWLSLADVLLPSTFGISFYLSLFWILSLMASLYIHFLLLFFWIPVWTPPLFFFSTLTFLTLLLSLIPHPLLQILS